MEVSHEASVRVSRGVHCMLSSCSGDRELPGGHARGRGGPPGWPPTKAQSLAPIRKRVPYSAWSMCVRYLRQKRARARATRRAARVLGFLQCTWSFACEMRARANASRQNYYLCSSFQHSSPTRRRPLSFLNQRGASRWVRRRRSTTCRSASTSPCGTSATRSTTFRTRGPSTRPEARRRAMA
jgi:hypothetical protein